MEFVLRCEATYDLGHFLTQTVLTGDCVKCSRGEVDFKHLTHLQLKEET